MIFIDASDHIHVDAKDIKTLISESSYKVLKSTFLENEIKEENFLSDNSSAVVVTSDGLPLACQMRDVAGLRLAVLPFAKENIRIDRKSWARLERAATKLGADLIQILVPSEMLHFVERHPGVFMENYLFERDLKIAECQISGNTAKIDFSDGNLLSWLAEVEFKTRLEFPGSTFRPKDWFGVINEEYCAMARLHSFEGLAVQGDPRKGFILWWNNLEKSNSIVVHLWVDPKYRGFGYGQFLIGDMLCKIQSAKITSCRYFVSAQNINALKILFKSKFSLKYCVINKAVKRKELL